MLSTETTNLISTCTSLTRVDRTRLVASFEPSYKHLNVCTRDGPNCSQCEKCMRTLLTLELIGKLDHYTSVFDLKTYYKKRSTFIASVKSMRHTDVFKQDIYDEMQRIGFKI